MAIETIEEQRAFDREQEQKKKQDRLRESQALAEQSYETDKKNPVAIVSGSEQSASDRLAQIQRLREHEDPAAAKEAQQVQRQAEEGSLYREIDLARGLERGQQHFGEGALGRVDQTRSRDIDTLQKQRMDIAQQGYGAEAFQAAREARTEGLNRAQQQQARQLRGMQGSTGVQGGFAGAQQMGLMEQQQRERQSAERQMFLDDVNQRQQAMTAAEQTTRSTEADELARRQYNYQQRKDEIMGRLTAQYGEASLGVAERGSAAAAAAAKEYGQAVANQGGEKVMAEMEKKKKRLTLSDVNNNLSGKTSEKKDDAIPQQTRLELDKPKDASTFSKEDKQKLLLGSLPTLIAAAAGTKEGLRKSGQIGAQAAEKYGKEQSLKKAQKSAADKSAFDRDLAIKKLDLDTEANRRKGLFEQQKLGLEQRKIDAQLAKERGKSGPRSYEQKLGKLGSEDKKKLGLIRVGKRSLQDMALALKGGQDTFKVVGSNDFTVATGRWNQAIGRLLSGAVIGEKEAEQFLDLVPRATDTRKMQATKLRDMSETMDLLLSGYNFSPEEVPEYTDPGFEQNIGEYLKGGSWSGDNRAIAAPQQRDVRQMSIDELKAELGGR